MPRYCVAQLSDGLNDRQQLLLRIAYALTVGKVLLGLFTRSDIESVQETVLMRYRLRKCLPAGILNRRKPQCV